jgi:hypothetical protein
VTRRQRLPLFIALALCVLIGITVTLIYEPQGQALQFWAALAGVGVVVWLAHKSLE